MISLLRIMYAPLDYIHHARFKKPAEGLSPSLQQAVNHSLIKRYQLETKFDFTVNSRDFSQHVVNDWRLLPKVAWLLGCKLVRGSLAANGQLATLPDAAHRFVALPIPCPAYQSNMAVSKSDIVLFGARYLYQLQPHLPAAIAQRLPLLFAPDAALSASVSGDEPALTLNRSLLTFAFDYAKNSSD